MRCARGSLAIAALVLAGCAAEKPVPAVPPPPVEASQTSGDSAVTGQGPAAEGGFPALIVLEPKVPREFAVPPEPRIMDQQGLAFLPHLMVVQQGQAVTFRNSEDVLHNVRVGEAGNGEPLFNVATVPGNAYSYTFGKPGFYTVACDVHENMHADILVAPTPYAVVAGDDGAFTIPDVPVGSYTLMVYQGGKRVDRAVEVSGARTVLK